MIPTTAFGGHPAAVANWPGGRANRPGAPRAGSPAPARAATPHEPGLVELLPAEFSARLLVAADRTVLVVCGELDLMTEGAFRGFLDLAASQAGHLVVIDLAGVTFIGASALGQLARILPRLRALGSELAIVSPSPLAYKLLHLTGFTSQIHVEQPSRDRR